jgi:hypothetical protein
MGAVKLVGLTARLSRHAVFAKSRLPRRFAPMLDSRHQGSPEGNKKPHQTREWIAMFALVERHPNIDVMIFYVVGSAIFALMLYRYHRKQV